MLAQIILFAAGSALCGAAPSLNFLIAGRSAFQHITNYLLVLTDVSFSRSRYRRWGDQYGHTNHSFGPRRLERAGEIFRFCNSVSADALSPFELSRRSL